MAAQGYNYLEGSQEDINRRLLRKILALESKVGSEGTDIGELEATVGDSSSGLVKDMADAKAAIGTDDTTAGSLKKRCKDIETAIGSESTEGSILARIKALEDAE